MIQSEKDLEQNQINIANSLSELAIKMKDTLLEVRMNLKKLEDKVDLLIQGLQMKWLIEKIRGKYLALHQPLANKEYLKAAQEVTSKELKIGMQQKTRQWVRSGAVSNVIEHPIYDNNYFTLLRVTGIPHFKDGTVQTPMLEGEFLAVKNNTGEYFIMGDSNLRHCLQEQEFIYICQPTTIRNLTARGSCELQDLYHMQNMCNFKTIQPKTLILISLLTTNAWIYVA